MVRVWTCGRDAPRRHLDGAEVLGGPRCPHSLSTPSKVPSWNLGVSIHDSVYVIIYGHVFHYFLHRMPFGAGVVPRFIPPPLVVVLVIALVCGSCCFPSGRCAHWHCQCARASAVDQLTLDTNGRTWVDHLRSFGLPRSTNLLSAVPLSLCATSEATTSPTTTCCG